MSIKESQSPKNTGRLMRGRGKRKEPPCHLTNKTKKENLVTTIMTLKKVCCKLLYLQVGRKR
jgi:hypothetical protein